MRFYQTQEQPLFVLDHPQLCFIVLSPFYQGANTDSNGNPYRGIYDYHLDHPHTGEFGICLSIIVDLLPLLLHRSVLLV